MTMLDKFLPIYEFNEVHQVDIQASITQAYAALKSVRLSDMSAFAGWLLTLRALPERLFGKDGNSFTNTKPLLEAMCDKGFVQLAEVLGHEVVIGTVGQPWKIVGGRRILIHDVEAFYGFDKPNYARIVTNLILIPDDVPSRVRCMTETRVHIPDPRSRRQFSFYWRFTSIGSGLIRHMWLSAIKRLAEDATSRP